MVTYVTGRNTDRKQMFENLLTFCKVAQDKDDMELLVNSVKWDDPNRDMKDWIERIFPRFGVDYEKIKNKIHFIQGVSFEQGFPEQMIADLISSSDVHLTLAKGEGFGMVIAHCISCNVPVIAHEFSTPKYLLTDKTGMRVKSTDIWHMENHSQMHPKVDLKDAEEKLQQFYDLWKKNAVFDHFSKEEMQEWTEKYTWDNVVKDWKRVIEETIN